MHLKRIREYEKDIFDTAFGKDKLQPSVRTIDLFRLLGPQYHTKMAQHLKRNLSPTSSVNKFGEPQLTIEKSKEISDSKTIEAEDSSLLRFQHQKKLASPTERPLAFDFSQYISFI